MRRLFVLLIVLMLALSPGVCALAEGGDGSGGGSGNPLTLDWSTVPDGSTDVPTDVTITLTFTKNVVNFTVRDNNMGCFTLVDSGGSRVPIAVIMGDDQVDTSIKRIISISPDPLSPGETYTLIISGNLQAKNGTYLGSDIYLTFTTAGAQETPPPAEETPTEEPPAEDPPDGTDEVPEQGDQVTEEPEEPAAEQNPENGEPAENEVPSDPGQSEEQKEKKYDAPADEGSEDTEIPTTGPSPKPADGETGQEHEEKEGVKSAVYYAAGGVVAAAALALVIFRKKK